MVPVTDPRFRAGMVSLAKFGDVQQRHDYPVWSGASMVRSIETPWLTPATDSLVRLTYPHP